MSEIWLVRSYWTGFQVSKHPELPACKYSYYNTIRHIWSIIAYVLQVEVLQLTKLDAITQAVYDILGESNVTLEGVSGGTDTTLDRVQLLVVDR